MTEYAVIIEKVVNGSGFGAYVPDLPGCVATGETREEVEQLIAEAIALHIKMIRESGDQPPVPRSSVSRVRV